MLGLDLKIAGRLLPREHRTRAGARAYKLPTDRGELSRLCAIPFNRSSRSPNTTYLRRARREWFATNIGGRDASAENIAYIKHSKNRVRQMVNRVEAEMSKVQESADKAVASLTGLFEMCREVLEGQLKAHLADQPWKGEKITAGAARQCFRLISSTVRGLNLPSDQRQKAVEVSMQEAAAAIKETRETAALAPGTGEESLQ